MSASRYVRAALLFLALVLGGCLRQPPEIEVVNVSSQQARGVITMWLDPGWNNDTARETGRWSFDVPAGATQDLGRLPREPAEYHYMVARADDGREGWGRPLNHAHVDTLVVRVTSDRIEIGPQGVT